MCLPNFVGNVDGSIQVDLLTIYWDLWNVYRTWSDLCWIKTLIDIDSSYRSGLNSHQHGIGYCNTTKSPDNVDLDKQGIISRCLHGTTKWSNIID